MEVKVEVTDEVRELPSGNKVQVCYVDLGGKYPEETTRFVGDSQPLAAGAYVATRGRIDNYRPVVDIQSLTRAK